MSTTDIELEAFLAEYLGNAQLPPPAPPPRRPRRARRGHRTIICLAGGPRGLLNPYERRLRK